MHYYNFKNSLIYNELIHHQTFRIEDFCSLLRQKFSSIGLTPRQNRKLVWSSRGVEWGPILNVKVLDFKFYVY
jgi:hypothetical protein